MYSICKTCGNSKQLSPKDCEDVSHNKVYKRRRETNNVYRKKRREENPYYATGFTKEEKKELSRLEYRNIRISIIKKLGGCCCICGCTDNRALNIAHIIQGNGLKERTEKGWRYLKDLKRMSIEILNKDYQCLCANCHAIKSYNEKYKSINTSKITKKENKGL